VSEKNNMVVDIQGDSNRSGAKILMYKKKSSAANNQLWYLDDSGCIRSVLNNMTFSSSGKGEDLKMTEQGGERGQWRPEPPTIKNGVGEVLDIRGDHNSEGSDLCAYEYKNQKNQHWRLDYVN